MKNIVCLAIALSTLFYSCGQDDNSIDPTSINGTANVYPEPPSGWMDASEPYNTDGWMGDVMPFYEDGKFHLFFLHDAQNKPAGKGFHDIHEFETTNLADYKYDGRMIPYGKDTEPDFGVGTGSIIKVGSLYYFYYTGHNGIASFMQDNPRESILYATSPDLKNWTKNTSFKLTAPTGYYDYDFRDPHVFYNEEAGKYWMLVSTQTDSSRKAVILLFTTSDPASNNWVPEGPLYTTTSSENYLMMECADIFKIGSYWYLVFSEDWSTAKGTHYRMATSSKGPWIKPENDKFDGEYFYAAKTTYDGNHRYLFGWTARKAPQNDNGNKEYAGNMVTHEIIQNSDGTLGVAIPETIASHFSRNLTIEPDNQLGNVTETTDGFSLDANLSPAIATFSKLGKSTHITTTMTLSSDNGNVGFIFGANNMSEQYCKIVYEAENHRLVAYKIKGTASSEITQVPFTLETGVAYDINIVCDGSICVVYVDEKIALSARIYSMRNQKWGFIAEDTSTTFTTPLIKKPE